MSAPPSGEPTKGVHKNPGIDVAVEASASASRGLEAAQARLVEAEARAAVAQKNVIQEI